MTDDEKKFVKISTLKEGGYVLIEGTVCQVRGIEKSKSGRHGASKARITAFDVFSGQKRNLLKPTDADAEVPIIKRSAAQVVAVMGDTVQIMDMQSYETMNVPKPENSSLASGVQVEYMKYGNDVKIIQKK
ncbi:MAG: translation initiation factor IF-5A [Candidatus Diapherotrites archaeon]